jgi:hypothetical protein
MQFPGNRYNASYASVSIDKDFVHVWATLTADSSVDFRQLARVHVATEKNTVDIHLLTKVSSVLGENTVDSRSRQ